MLRLIFVPVLILGVRFAGCDGLRRMVAPVILSRPNLGGRLGLALPGKSITSLQ